jgi:hypothetical protein
MRPRGNPRSSGYARQTLDWYVEPEWSVEGLFDVEKFTGTILDPACGSGTIVRVCRARGLEARGSDIVDRGYGYPVADFFGLTAPVDNLISNMPFGAADQFIPHALELARDKVAILGRLTLLEGQKRRQRIWGATPLCRVWVFSRRVSMPPGDQNLPAIGGSVAYAWFIWQHGYRGPASIGFIP